MKIMNDFFDYSEDPFLFLGQQSAYRREENSSFNIREYFYRSLPNENWIKNNDLLSYTSIWNNSIPDYTFSNDIQTNIVKDNTIKRKYYYDKLLDSITNDEFEYGKTSRTEYVLKMLLSENNLLAKDALNNICVKNYSNVNIICGLLRVISHFDYEELKPQCMLIVTSLVTHKNEEIVECAIRCCENWGNAEVLNVIKNTSCRSDWMNEYLQKVIENITEEIQE